MAGEKAKEENKKKGKNKKQEFQQKALAALKQFRAEKLVDEPKACFVNFYLNYALELYIKFFIEINSISIFKPFPSWEALKTISPSRLPLLFIPKRTAKGIQLVYSHKCAELLEVLKPLIAELPDYIPKVGFGFKNKLEKFKQKFAEISRILKERLEIDASYHQTAKDVKEIEGQLTQHFNELNEEDIQLSDLIIQIKAAIQYLIKPTSPIIAVSCKELAPAVEVPTKNKKLQFFLDKAKEYFNNEEEMRQIKQILISQQSIDFDLTDDITRLVKKIYASLATSSLDNSSLNSSITTTSTTPSQMSSFYSNLSGGCDDLVKLKTLLKDYCRRHKILISDTSHSTPTITAVANNEIGMTIKPGNMSQLTEQWLREAFRFYVLLPYIKEKDFYRDHLSRQLQQWIIMLACSLQMPEQQCNNGIYDALKNTFRVSKHFSTQQPDNPHIQRAVAVFESTCRCFASENKKLENHVKTTSSILTEYHVAAYVSNAQENDPLTHITKAMLSNAFDLLHQITLNVDDDNYTCPATVDKFGCYLCVLALTLVKNEDDQQRHIQVKAMMTAIIAVSKELPFDESNQYHDDFYQHWGGELEQFDKNFLPPLPPPTVLSTEPLESPKPPKSQKRRRCLAFRMLRCVSRLFAQTRRTTNYNPSAATQTPRCK